MTIINFPTRTLRHNCRNQFLFLLVLMIHLFISCTVDKDTEEHLQTFKVENGIKTIEITGFQNLTMEVQNEIIKKVVAEMKSDTSYSKTVITDGGVKVKSLSLIPENEIHKYFKDIEPKETFDSNGIPDIRFSVIEESPIFPGCKNDSSSNTEIKECTQQKITSFVRDNFNKKRGDGMDIVKETSQIIYVEFRINNKGVIEILKAKGGNPDMVEEAKRVIHNLPQMVPGRHKGEEVGVLYSLPIHIE